MGRGCMCRLVKGHDNGKVSSIGKGSSMQLGKGYGYRVVTAFWIGKGSSIQFLVSLGTASAFGL